MLRKNQGTREQMEFFSLEDMVPENHLLRQIDAAIDFNRIYEFVENLYCEDNGRPSIDPVVLFKIVLIQHIYGISSLRRTLEEVNMNLAYRWFIGYPLSATIPHFSTVSYNFKHRFNTATVEYVFRWVLKAAANEGYLDTEAIFVDGTHIKASANMKKQAKKAVPKEAKRYAKELFDEVNKVREDHDQKPFKDDGNNGGTPETHETTVSTTDPESGVFHKGEHRKCFAYEAHTACDKNNFVLDVEVTPGNVHDSVAFDSLYDQICEHFPEHQTVVADSAYKTPWICKRIFGSGRVLSTAYKRPMTKSTHPWHYYVYDEYYDCVVCPEYKVLHYSTTNREGYREYKSRSYICSSCETRELCTANAKCEKTVTRHVWQRYVDMADDARYIPEYRDLYKQRKEKIERVFADAKEKHGMRYTQYRGLAQVTNWVKLKFAAMNLKKLARWKWKKNHRGSSGTLRSAFSLLFSLFEYSISKTRLWLRCQSRVFLQAEAPPENRWGLFFRLHS